MPLISLWKLIEIVAEKDRQRVIREYEKDENFKQKSDVYELAEGIWIDLAAMKEKRGRKEERKTMIWDYSNPHYHNKQAKNIVQSTTRKCQGSSSSRDHHPHKNYYDKKRHITHTLY